MINKIHKIVTDHLLPAENYIFGTLKLGMDARICGICVAACPIGRM